MNDFYKAMVNTAEQCGLKIISDDFCCKLLAWLYVFGGGNENVVYNTKLRADILTAQKRLNLFGSEIANQELQPILKRYVKDCEDSLKKQSYEERQNSKPDWAMELEERYGLKTS